MGERGGGSFLPFWLLTSPYPSETPDTQDSGKDFTTKASVPYIEVGLGFVYSQPIKKPGFSFYLGI